jgi:hypothetical protein
MSSYKHKAGRTWEIKVSLGAIARILKKTDVDITQIHDPKGKVIKQIGNPATFFDVLCSACDIDALGVTPEDFGAAFDEATCDAASRALAEGVIDFFPESKRRIVGTAFRKYLTALDKKTKEDLKQADEKLQSLDFEKAVNGDTESKDSAGNSPESLEPPTSTDSPSVS